jgi:hypothetical protein
MKIRTYIQQREKATNYMERVFTVRMLRAFKLSVQPLYDHLELLGVNGLGENLINTKPIEQALNWLYADWGYKYGARFAKNLPVQRKDFWEDELKRLLGTKAAMKVTEIVNTTKKLARKAIQEALTLANEGASIDKIQKAIKTSIESEGGLMSQGRARMIARTEVISASNTATHESVRLSGAKTEHKWLTGGANIRDTHIAAEAQGWKPFDEPFRVGQYSMMHPGDPSGGAEEVINCKCVEIFRVVD